MKILVTGDWHLDACKIGRVNPLTDLDLRIEDFLNAIDRIIDYAIENKIDLFILNGDLFKGRTSSHHIETLFAERIKKITDHMPLGINLGNHDYTSKSLNYNTHTYSIVEKLKIDNVFINTHLNHFIFEDVDVVLYPYYDHKTRSDYEFKNSKEIIDFIDKTIKSYKFTKPCKLFIGHGTPEGTMINEEWFLDLDIIEEPIIPKSILSNFEMSLFSHIHRSHAIGSNIFHIGSPERVDFAEAKHDKGFVVYDTKLHKMEFISTSPRPMLTLDLDLSKLDEFTNPTDYVIKNIEKIEDIDNTLLKVVLSCSQQVRMELDDNKIKNQLTKAYHFTYRVKTFIEERESRAVEVTEHLSEATALEKVLESKDFTEDVKKSILIRGKGVIASNEA